MTLVLPTSENNLYTYNLYVKKEAPMVGVTALLNIPPTYLITTHVLPTPENILYTYNLYVKKEAPMVGLTALLNIPPTYLITTQ